jgi:hypothetical protein
MPGASPSRCAAKEKEEEEASPAAVGSLQS